MNYFYYKEKNLNVKLLWFIGVAVVWMKGQVLRRAREHLKEPGSSVFNELLTKKFPTFLSRL